MTVNLNMQRTISALQATIGKETVLTPASDWNVILDRR